jgi:signal peptidase I
MSEQNENKDRQEALDTLFNDDPGKKAKEKEEARLEKKRLKEQEKAEKKAKKKGKENKPEDEGSAEEASENTLSENDGLETDKDDVHTTSDGDEKQVSEDNFEPASSIDDSSVEEAEKDNSKKQKKKKDEPEKKEINIVKDLINLCIYILVVIALCWVVLTYVGQRTEVSGDSMNNTLHSGDSLWIDKLSYHFKDPERFDIVVFPPYEDEEDTYYIKRIIGLPGETIYIDEAGTIYINDEPLEGDVYGKEVIEESHRGVASEPVTLGDDEYFVMGDNRNNSRDSRVEEVGNVKRDQFTGKAVFRFTGGFGFLNND